ncbi:hypothetical protein NEOLEDRAFT_1142191 [Neolentinus lepideus HHB14362 ss-1]|uniref:Proteasome assembly chaperone 1 n=1 Tax=Neolentinus lepideus HHB14362 ss-1 TaxID=1314782 RepID=A0A165N9F7_9AGAM|nr:hypothetical protein NEOLEDRAFT_1142191 [Neolentinus lepideus HHB14362 ss-1]
MDSTDALTDTISPRYAVESDEEDEENPLLSSPSRANRVTDVKIDGSCDTCAGKPLLLAIGLAAQTWTKGVQLGEPIATVVLNGAKVGYIFSPAWTQATVVVSEATIRIPTWAMYSYAEALTSSLKPTRTAILDIYSVPQYIDVNSVPAPDAPLRYLTTDTRSPTMSKLSLFSPPNVLQSTSAAFMLLSSFTSGQPTPSTLILLPSPYSQLPPTSELTSLGLTQKIGWPDAVVSAAHESLLACLGESAQALRWERGRTPENAPWLAVKRDEPPPDSGMYI